MNILIDGKKMIADDGCKNIVELADKNGIEILAPCYRTNRKGGCCKACLIEIDGKKTYACATMPRDNMNIVYNRTDLEAERKKKLVEFNESLSQEKTTKCSCSCDCNAN